LALAASACAGPSSIHLAAAVGGKVPPLPSARAAMAGRARVERVTGPRIPILLYHRIAVVAGDNYPALTVDPYRFSDQMDAIAASGAVSLTMSQVVDAARNKTVFPRGVIAITFDDATEDQFLYVFPVLQRDHLHATFFVPTGRVGRPGYLTWAQIETMRASGLIEFGAHTINHRDLTKMARAQAWQEIAGSRAILEARLHTAVTSFAYPFGTFDREIEALVLLAGYSNAVTTAYQWTHPIASALLWGRIEVHETNVPKDLGTLARASGDVHMITTTLDVRASAS
jgi:peptidoglycan/xylan/chitin deacetylase (PgdA/CDA1 family)